MLANVVQQPPETTYDLLMNWYGWGIQSSWIFWAFGLFVCWTRLEAHDTLDVVVIDCRVVERYCVYRPNRHEFSPLQINGVTMIFLVNYPSNFHTIMGRIEDTLAASLYERGIWIQRQNLGLLITQVYWYCSPRLINASHNFIPVCKWLLVLCECRWERQRFNRSMGQRSTTSSINYKSFRLESLVQSCWYLCSQDDDLFINGHPVLFENVQSIYIHMMS